MKQTIIKIIVFFFINATLIAQEYIQNDDLIQLLEKEGILQQPTESQFFGLSNYLIEISNIIENIEKLRPALQSQKLIQNQETYIDVKNYRVNFFERKEELVFSEFAKIEWDNKVIRRIIFRDRSVYSPQYTRKLIYFILPKIEKSNNNIMEPELFFITSISYSAGLGKRRNYYFPRIFQARRTEHTSMEKITFYNESYQIDNFTDIRDASLKLRLIEYILYRMRNLEIRIKAIFFYNERKNKFDFYETIPDDKY